MSKIKEITSSDIKDKVKDFVNNNFLQTSGLKNISDDDSFFEKRIIDSTGILELVSFIEVTFGFRVEDEELIPDNLDSVDKIVSFIKMKKS